MNERDYCYELYEKMAAEQDAYRDWLRSQSAEEILNHACEYTIREDIVMAMGVMATEEIEKIWLSPQHAKALLDSPSPLADVYTEWNNAESNHMDDIRAAIVSRAAYAMQNSMKETGKQAPQVTVSYKER